MPSFALAVTFVLFCRTICQVYFPVVACAVGLEDHEASGVAVVRATVPGKVVGRPEIVQLGVFVGGGEVDDGQLVGATGADTNAEAEVMLRAAIEARDSSRCMILFSQLHRDSRLKSDLGIL